MDSYLVLRVVAKLLMPFIFLFALYVQFHGDFGPGGGFQAGVIFAAGFILYALIFGLKNAASVIPVGVLRFGIALGVLLYAGVGVFNLVGRRKISRILGHGAKFRPWPTSWDISCRTWCRHHSYLRYGHGIFYLCGAS